MGFTFPPCWSLCCFARHGVIPLGYPVDPVVEVPGLYGLPLQCGHLGHPAV
jgi:hypothetical protein